MIDVPTGISAGRTVTLDRADVGTNFVQVLDYIGACPGLHTFLFRGQRRADDPEAAGLEGNVIGRLHFGAGNARERVDFDLTEGGACVTVPVERSAYFEARFEDVGGEAPVLWESVSVTAMGMPGSVAHHRDLTLTSSPQTLVGAAAEADFLVPRWAYAARVVPTDGTVFTTSGWFLRFFAGESSATAQLFAVNSVVAGDENWTPSALWGNAVLVPGGARILNLLQSPAQTRTFRVQWLLRV